MNNILIVSGLEKSKFANGKLNQTFVNTAQASLSTKYQVNITNIFDGYSVEEEHKKFKWADAIIFQYPIYWMMLSPSFKKYLDEVYSYGVFYEGSEEYGAGGLMKGKKYMLSTTWNAPKSAFNNTSNKLFKGKTQADILLPMTISQEYCGFEPMKHFSVHDVIRNPDFEKFHQDFINHIKSEFNL